MRYDLLDSMHRGIVDSVLSGSVLLFRNWQVRCGAVCVQLGHLKCNHGVWLTIGNILANGTSNLLPLVSSVAEESLFRWMRAAELTCDRCVHGPTELPGAVPISLLCCKSAKRVWLHVCADQHC